MYYGRVPGVDKEISRFVQGAVMIRTGEIERSFALLDEIRDLGCTAFDTAHQYGAGESERALGRWMEERSIRDGIVVIGKGAHHNQDRTRVTPFDITADLFDSLARLRTDYIDLYLLHRDDPSVPVGPIIETLNEHLDAGRIHAFGASNWSTERIRETNEYAEERNLVPFAASSPNLSLAVQAKEPWAGCVSVSGPKGEAERRWYAEQEMPLFTWSSLAGGFFSGRFTRDNLDSFDSYLDELCVETYCYEGNFARLDRARILAEDRGLTVPQVALAYVLAQPLDVFALVGCNTGAEFRDNVQAAETSLTPDDLTWLENGDDTKRGAASSG
ncbi:MAG: aldo/keto reductase [Rubrobacter sp.]|nr:aldo/keto reductase [Rubrobacter sp.]